MIGRFNPSLCINRNILECKEMTSEQLYITRTGINRNILECKEKFNIGFSILVFVLIETYWNVKNVDTIKWMKAAGGINRNILECKVPQGGGTHERATEY